MSERDPLDLTARFTAKVERRKAVLARSTDGMSTPELESYREELRQAHAELDVDLLAGILQLQEKSHDTWRNIMDEYQEPDRETIISNYLEFEATQGREATREQAEEHADAMIEGLRETMARGPSISKLPEGFVRVVGSEDLVAMNTEAKRQNYNRVLPDELVAELDPDGTHVISFTLPHEHAKGKKVDPHMRLQLFIKLKDRTEAVEDYMLDVTLEHYNRIPILAKNEQTGEWDQLQPGDPREVLLAQGITGEE